ncbi:hypothetical protein FRC03_002567 [Tulasnella sp. 419]|nr:hypothetical protein FRC03_002567 [Tulasnella sp. 419]
MSPHVNNQDLQQPVTSAKSDVNISVRSVSISTTSPSFPTSVVFDTIIRYEDMGDI